MYTWYHVLDYLYTWWRKILVPDSKMRSPDGTYAQKGRVVNDRVVNSRIPLEVYSLLKQAASAEGLSISEYIRYLIEDSVLL